MNFEESVACLALGIGFAIALIWVLARPPKKSVDTEDLVFGLVFIAAIIGAPIWCIIVGLHYFIKAW